MAHYYDDENEKSSDAQAIKNKYQAMETKEILKMLSRYHYASVFVTSNVQRVKFGPGELLWYGSLRTAIPEIKEILVEDRDAAFPLPSGRG